MLWVYIFLLTLTIVNAKDDEINEITAPLNLDANLRRALLRALTELENEEKQNDKIQHNFQDDKIIEKASASALSLYASTGTSTTTETDQTPTTTEKTTQKPFVLIQRSNSVQHKPITTIENYNIDPVNEAEQILTSASSSFAASNRFYSKKDGDSINTIRNEIKPKIDTTTVSTTTTSTTTEENQAKVEDVQFFSAPLVAAFTVHQDERGLPKSVEPIYRTIQKPLKETKFQTNQFLLRQQQEDLKAQLVLQQKQKALEEEILRLKQQQEQQNYLIRQQQFYHEQQLRLQQQKLEEQLRLQKNLQTQTNHHHQNQFNSNESRIRNNGLVTFQKSVSLNNGLPINAQQLPLKNPVNFLSSPPPFRPHHNFITTEQQLPTTNNANFNDLQQLQQLPSTNNANFNGLQQNSFKHNRVFRQETGTGNFFNNGFNNQFQQQETRFFRQPVAYNQIQPPIVNHQLNNLLYNSGIYHGKQQEDLNIVSKVLSLNHLGGTYRFGSSSNIDEQRVPFIRNV